MEKQRHVDKAMSTFDLKIGRAISLPECIRTRVMMTYDRKGRSKTFIVLNPHIPRDVSLRIIAWLETHVDVCSVIEGINSNRIDADAFGGKGKGPGDGTVTCLCGMHARPAVSQEDRS